MLYAIHTQRTPICVGTPFVYQMCTKTDCSLYHTVCVPELFTTIVSKGVCLPILFHEQLVAQQYLFTKLLMHDGSVHRTVCLPNCLFTRVFASSVDQTVCSPPLFVYHKVCTNCVYELFVYQICLFTELLAHQSVCLPNCLMTEQFVHQTVFTKLFVHRTVRLPNVLCRRTVRARKSC